MGLDNYAMRAPGEELTDDDTAAFKAEGPNLCGGIMNSDKGSFRGKVYCTLVRLITGEDLHDDFIPPDRVKAMYEALRAPHPRLAGRRRHPTIRLQDSRVDWRISLLAHDCLSIYLAIA